jgi:hypothetical protein
MDKTNPGSFNEFVAEGGASDVAAYTRALTGDNIVESSRDNFDPAETGPDPGSFDEFVKSGGPNAVEDYTRALAAYRQTLVNQDPDLGFRTVSLN